MTELLMFNQSVSEHYLTINITEDLILERTQEFFVLLQTTSELVNISTERATVIIGDGPVSGVPVTAC